jgi:hypothetical protein
MDPMEKEVVIILLLPPSFREEKEGGGNNTKAKVGPSYFFKYHLITYVDKSNPTYFYISFAYLVLSTE